MIPDFRPAWDTPKWVRAAFWLHLIYWSAAEDLFRGFYDRPDDPFGMAPFVLGVAGCVLLALFAPRLARAPQTFAKAPWLAVVPTSTVLAVLIFPLGKRIVWWWSPTSTARPDAGTAHAVALALGAFDR